MIINKDCLEALKELPDNSIDSIVTDPPAGISFMNKSWDDDKGGRDNWIAWMQEIATECHRVLKPGGHGLVWSIPRTSHWTAMAWENAGFEIRDNISHVFGSGFPKSLNIGKAVDKLQGDKREVTGKGKPMSSLGTMHDDNWESNSEYMETKGNSEWEGWGTALKPAREDWWLIRKPIEKGLSIAENCLKYGVGGINIDGSRVEAQGETMSRPFNEINEENVWNSDNSGYKKRGNPNNISDQLGRFPANLIHDGSEEVLELFPTSKSTLDKSEINRGTSKSWFTGDHVDRIQRGDSGSAARFFKNCEFNETETAQRFLYCPKASKSERNMGLDGFEEKEIDNQQNSEYKMQPNGELVKAVHNKRANNHPTVKPIKLMEYLVNLVSKEGHTVLDPFAGSGTTGIACKKLNRNFIGVERDPEYCKIAEARINAI